jgi:hypothetical protein
MNQVAYNDLYSTASNHLPLQKALDIHYALNPQFTHWYKYHSDIAKKLVKAHDISHLVFGCDTQLLGEMQVQLWAKFAVQPFGWRETLSYARDKESKVLLKNPVGYRRMLIFFIQNFSQVKKIKLQAAKMPMKWRYFEEDQYMNTTLGDLRAAYGIAICAP